MSITLMKCIVKACKETWLRSLFHFETTQKRFILSNYNDQKPYSVKMILRIFSKKNKKIVHLYTISITQRGHTSLHLVIRVESNPEFPTKQGGSCYRGNIAMQHRPSCSS